MLKTASHPTIRFSSLRLNFRVDVNGSMVLFPHKSTALAFSSALCYCTAELLSWRWRSSFVCQCTISDWTLQGEIEGRCGRLCSVWNTSSSYGPILGNIKFGNVSCFIKTFQNLKNNCFPDTLEENIQKLHRSGVIRTVESTRYLKSPLPCGTILW